MSSVGQTHPRRMASATASRTTPGSHFHVPSPTAGITAPLASVTSGCPFGATRESGHTVAGAAADVVVTVVTVSTAPPGRIVVVVVVVVVDDAMARTELGALQEWARSERVARNIHTLDFLSSE